MSEVFVCYTPATQKGPWSIRIDKPHGREAHHQEHVHITRKGLKGEYSWNKDGTRHDKHRFPASEQNIAAAKRLASGALNVSAASLQFLAAAESSCTVSVSESPPAARARSLLSVYVHRQERLILLGSASGALVAVRDEA
ncbi:DUF6367 family protein [Xanthomonas axonopodis pv. poinsettiicola]|uniref:DUF6367 family protein n=1 Tax=Xanthomonas TaxID=338 RepID=UPI0031C114C4|nr:DUF6367 family protein [Xanthomonas codiaei]